MLVDEKVAHEGSALPPPQDVPQESEQPSDMSKLIGLEMRLPNCQAHEMLTRSYSKYTRASPNPGDVSRDGAGICTNSKKGER